MAIITFARVHFIDPVPMITKLTGHVLVTPQGLDQTRRTAFDLADVEILAPLFAMAIPFPDGARDTNAASEHVSLRG